MCFTAAWLAQVSRIVFGCSMSEAIAATGGAQRELNVSAESMNTRSGGLVELSGGLLREECLGLFKMKPSAVTV